MRPHAPNKRFLPRFSHKLSHVNILQRHHPTRIATRHHRQHIPLILHRLLLFHNLTSTYLDLTHDQIQTHQLAGRIATIQPPDTQLHDTCQGMAHILHYCCILDHATAMNTLPIQCHTTSHIYHTMLQHACITQPRCNMTCTVYRTLARTIRKHAQYTHACHPRRLSPPPHSTPQSTRNIYNSIRSKK